MQKILFAVAALISYVPVGILADGKLQLVADIVTNMDSTRLCELDCKPLVSVDGTILTLSFNTMVADGVDTNFLCKCMKDYMRESVGDASSDCVVNGNQFSIVYHGEYSRNEKPVAPLTTLSNVLSNYVEPDLGGYKCSKEIWESDGHIHIKSTYEGKDYKSACAGILKYLNQNNFLDGASSDCTEFDGLEKAVLHLWASE